MAKEFFKNLPDTTTPLNASRLNGMLNGSESMGSIVVKDVRCKNLFNINALTLQAGSIDCTTGTITVNQYANGTNEIFKKIAPDLEVGKTYILSFKTTGENNFIYVAGRKAIWTNGTTITITEEDLNDAIIFYGNYNSTNTVVISEIQIEEGTTATEYTPYKAFGATSGSNSNGSWIKYDDGTMIQWGIVKKSGTISKRSGITQWYYDDAYTVNLPQNFISNSYYANVNIESLALITMQVYSVTDYSTNLFKFNLSASIEHTFSNYNFRWFAIGKWK